MTKKPKPKKNQSLKDPMKKQLDDILSKIKEGDLKEEAVLKENDSNQDQPSKKEKSTLRKIISINSDSKVKVELESLKKEYKYLQAEFANYKRTSFREFESSQKYKIFNFTQELLLNVVNDFNRAMDQKWNEDDLGDFQKGIGMIHQKLIHHFNQFGVEEICPKEGDVSDPNLHEIIGQAASDSIEEGSVVDTCRRGYKLHDRLVQPAQVIVSSGASEKEEEN